MHLLVIVCDSLRRDFIGAYGNSWIHTPNIDALAGESLVFDGARIGSFPTIPQRAELMAGHHVFHTTGWAPLVKGEVTFPMLLHEAGYTTAMVTDHIQFLGPGMNYHQGFDVYQFIRGHQGDHYRTTYPPVPYPCDAFKLRQPEMLVRPHLMNNRGRLYEREWHDPQTVQAAIDWLEDNYQQEQFMLYLDLFGIHEPWDGPAWLADLYDDPDYAGDEIILPRYDRAEYLTGAELQHIRACYAGMVTMTDRWLGRLFETLKLMGLWDSTAILFTSDHGWYHGEHGYVGKHTVIEPELGWPLYDQVARVPLLLRVPGLAEEGRCRALVQPVDLMPTLLDLAGLPPPEGLHGASLGPLLTGEADAVRNLAVSSPTLALDPEVRVYSTISDGRWTLIDSGAWGDRELYDTASDPGQLDDVSDAYPLIVEELHGRYVQALDEIGTDGAKLALRL